MKKKIIFAVATGFFAVATMFNMDMVQANRTGDISLEGVAVMAQAYGENPQSVCRYIDFLGRCAISWSFHSYCPTWAC